LFNSLLSPKDKHLNKYLLFFEHYPSFF
jgi:hypothetical protein